MVSEDAFGLHNEVLIANNSFQMRILKFVFTIITSIFCFKENELGNIANSTLTIDPSSSFIVLTTALSTNIPLLMDFNMDFEQKTWFQFGSRTEVFWSCGATLNGNFYIFGGLNEKRQVIAKVKW